jgi:hypothetical protein
MGKQNRPPVSCMGCPQIEAKCQKCARLPQSAKDEDVKVWLTPKKNCVHFLPISSNKS